MPVAHETKTSRTPTALAARTVQAVRVVSWRRVLPCLSAPSGDTDLAILSSVASAASPGLWTDVVVAVNSLLLTVSVFVDGFSGHFRWSAYSLGLRQRPIDCFVM